MYKEFTTDNVFGTMIRPIRSNYTRTMPAESSEGVVPGGCCTAEERFVFFLAREDA